MIKYFLILITIFWTVQLENDCNQKCEDTRVQCIKDCRHLCHKDCQICEKYKPGCVPKCEIQQKVPLCDTGCDEDKQDCLNECN